MAISRKRRTYLTVDDVIARLQEYRDEHGNIPVRIRLAGMMTRPVISGIRFELPNHNGRKGSGAMPNGVVEIVPKYDIKGAVNELSSMNSIVRQMADVKMLFVNYGTVMMKTKDLIEDIQRRGHQDYKAVREEFAHLYGMAKSIRDGVKSLEDFDKRMMKVVQEPFLDGDYAAAYSHHIDLDMSDCEFARILSDGIGEKTSVQRLAVYEDVIRKIDAEIQNRERRIVMLRKRVKDEKSSSEGQNAASLIKRAESIKATLQQRRDYVSNRFLSLKKKILENMQEMEDRIIKTASVGTTKRRR